VSRREGAEVVSAFLVVATFAVAGFADGRLPDTILTHFGLNGAADAYTPKGSIWQLPWVNAGMYLFLSLIQRIPPDLYNLPVDRPTMNRPAVYAVAVEMLAVIKVFPILTVLLMEWAVVESATASQSVPEITLLILVPTLILAFVVLWYIAVLRRAAKS